MDNLTGTRRRTLRIEAFQIIDELRYIDIAQTFRVLCDLYATARSDEEPRRILQSVEVLARNDINEWRQVGFGVQKALYDAIRALPELDKKSLRTVIVTACRLFLDTELQGTTWHFDSVSLQRGAVLASAAYGEFRRDTIATLFELYGHSASLGEIRESWMRENCTSSL